MKMIYALALICFIGIAVFGFCGFSSNPHAAFMQCLKSINGTECPGNVPSGIYHAGLYMEFSLAVITLFFLVFAARVLQTNGKDDSKQEAASYESRRMSLANLADSKTQLLRWIKMFETKAGTLPA